MLFKKLEEVMEYAGITAGTTFASLASTISNVEKWHIVPILDKALYNELNTAYQLITNETSLSLAHQQLLHHCRNVIGAYLCYYYTPKAELTLSDSGARRAETDKLKTAYQYQVANFRKQHLLEGETHCETLLEFLDDNKSSYPLWVNSPAFQAYNHLFIRTAKEFNELYPTASPYRNYWAIRFKMFDAEELYIKKNIGNALFAALKTKIANTDPLSAAEQQLLTYVKKTVAYLSVAMALPYLTVRLDENGFTVTSEKGRSTNDNTSKSGDAGDTKISHLLRKCNSDGTTWLKATMEFISENLTEFPLFPAAQANDADGGETQSPDAAIYGLV